MTVESKREREREGYFAQAGVEVAGGEIMLNAHQLSNGSWIFRIFEWQMEAWWLFYILPQGFETPKIERT